MKNIYQQLMTNIASALKKKQTETGRIQKSNGED